jgi:hypothetical protein
MDGPGRDGAARYEANASRYAADRDRQALLSRRISYARLVTFLGAAAAVLSLFPGPVAGAAIRLSVGAAGFLTFGVLVYWHSRVEARERWFATLSLVNGEAAARVAREWDRLAPSGEAGPGPAHAFADDLDLFGRASLFELLGWAGTDPGRRTLSSWLTAPAPPDTVRARQQAVAELAGLASFREDFAALGRLANEPAKDVEGFLEWAEGGRWLRGRRWLPWTARALALLVGSLLAAQLAGLTDRPLWLYPVLLSLAVLAVYEKPMLGIFSRVFARSRPFEQYAALFSRITGRAFTSPTLRRIQQELRESGVAADVEMARLDTIRQYADLRLVVIFHPVIALLTLWDVHVLAELERWQARTAPHLRRWLAALGEFDALAALAALAHDNPGWAFPEIVERGDRLDATALGHPLLPGDRRVPNDVSVGPPGSFLLVTGSNMSGKSTLLRAVGLNVVLAQAGGPVCADSMRLPPLALCTSMRIEDSLEAGVSYFMAGLQRLALVVSAARAASRGGPLLLYLLDEVLQGTNTAERQVAVRRILGHLLALPVIGAVTTHDLELAACEELSAASRPVHFSEGIEGVGPAGRPPSVAQAAAGARLSFDYTLKPGIATSRNALKLLRMMGLDDASDQPVHAGPDGGDAAREG